MSIDYKLFSLINGLAGHHQFLDTLMIAMAKYGEYLFALYLLYLWFKPLNKEGSRKLVFKAILSTAIAVMINQVIGFIYFRPRPFASHEVNMLIDKSPDPSFPSDHATGSNALSWSIIWEDRTLGYLMLFTSLLLMISRVYVGTHYPFDVIGGAFTGFIGSRIANLVWPYFDKLASRLLTIYNRFMPV